jgi:hypothetical protein
MQSELNPEICQHREILKMRISLREPKWVCPRLPPTPWTIILTVAGAKASLYGKPVGQGQGQAKVRS